MSTGNHDQPNEPQPREPKLLERVRRTARAQHKSLHTERAYVSWIRRFILYHDKRHPADMAEAEINAFVTHLAADRGVSASTQTQALSAIVFLYRYVLKKPVGELEGLLRAKKTQKIPVVLSPSEVARIVSCAANNRLIGIGSCDRRVRQSYLLDELDGSSRNEIL